MIIAYYSKMYGVRPICSSVSMVTVVTMVIFVFNFFQIKFQSLQLPVSLLYVSVHCVNV